MSTSRHDNTTTMSPAGRVWRGAVWVVIALVVAMVSYGILVLGGH